MKNTNLFNRLITAAMVTIITLFVAALAVSAQTEDEVAKQEQLVKAENGDTAIKSRSVEPMPVFTGYKGIQIGMSAEDVRQKVDSLKQKGDAQDFFVFSEVETAQVFYDQDGKVKAVSVDYLGKDSNAPSPKDVLGEDLQIKADGSMYAMRRYPAVGYWVSYNRTAGESPIVSITMQRLN